MAGEIGKLGSQVNKAVSNDIDEDSCQGESIVEKVEAKLTHLKDHFVGLAGEVKQVVLDPSKIKEHFAEANEHARADLHAGLKGEVDAQRFAAMASSAGGAFGIVGSVGKTALTTERLSSLGMPSQVATGSVAGMKLWGNGGLREVLAGGRASLTGNATLNEGRLTVEHMTVSPASTYSRSKKARMADESEDQVLKAMASELAGRGVKHLEVKQYVYMRPNQTEHSVKSLSLDLKKFLGE